ncbi:uncharacterized protein LOC108668607 [Hyalella azteca]|uniref:Uncharacterized protein LOC108668607 n=1 Tax=Hyalella azteca TaxID=294128 RepID=A0A979FS97_HYAAZ|nr:uncharacterized protein LOC108668607 [Hyalella azteca]
MIRSHAQLSSPVRKKRRRFEHHYDRDLLNTAVQQVKNGELGINEASDKYNIPRTTISSRLRKDGWYSKDTILPDPELSPRIKNELLVWLKTMRQMSCSTVLSALPFVMQEVCEMSGEHTLFAASNLPPVGYCRRFLDEIRIQKEKELKNSEGTVVWKSNSCSVIDLWLKNLDELFEIQYGLDADSFLSGSEVNARQIYCCHRLAMVLKREDGGTGKLVHCQPPHQKHLPSIITMFTCVGVDGSALTPLFVAKSRSSEQKYFAKSKTSFPSFEVWSKECVMDADVFLDWLQLIVRELGDDETNRPLLLFLDQSIGIISLAVLDFCRDNMIILFYLPDTTAGSRLPFGSAIFDELIKSSPEFSGRSKRSITKAHSLQVLPKLWSCLQKEVIIAEFRRVGLVPLDKKVLECCMTPVSGVNNHLRRNNPGEAVNGSMDSSSPRLEISFVTSESEVLSSVPEPISKNVNMRSTCKKSSMSSTPHVPLAYSKSCLESAQNIPCESAQDSSMPQPNEQDKLLPGTNKRKRKQPLANSASPRLPKKTKKTTSAVVSSTQVNHEADKSPAINSDVGQAVKSRKKSAATNMAAVKMEPSDVEMPTRNSADTGSPSEPAVKPKQKRKKVRSPPEALVETVEECKVEDSQVALMEGTETKQSEGGSSITAKFRIVVDNSKRKKKDKLMSSRLLHLALLIPKLARPKILQISTRSLRVPSPWMLAAFIAKIPKKIV